MQGKQQIVWAKNADGSGWTAIQGTALLLTIERHKGSWAVFHGPDKISRICETIEGAQKAAEKYAFSDLD